MIWSWTKSDRVKKSDPGVHESLGGGVENDPTPSIGKDVIKRTTSSSCKADCAFERLFSPLC